MGNQLQAIQDPLITGVSSAYIPKGYVSEMILPVVPVVQSTGKLGRYGNQHLRIVQTLIGGEGKYRRYKPITRLTDSYEIEGHGLEGMVSKDDYRNVQQPFDAEKDEAIGLGTVIWNEKEKALADTLTSTTIVTNNVTLSGNAQFNDYSNSDPLAKFKTARQTVRGACGAVPDTAIMDWDVADTLAYHPQLLDFLGFKEARPGGLTHQEIAKALGVRRVLIAEAKYNSAAQGQTDVLSNIWGKHIVFGVLPERAEKYQVTAGYTVRYANQPPRKVYKWDVNNPPESKAILVTDEYDHLISNAGGLYLIEDAIA